MGAQNLRFHGLDFLRATAMLLGLLFHAPILYYIPPMADGFREFGVSSEMMPEMESWLKFTIQWLHSWRMCVFFVISGFFSALVLNNKSLNFFIKDRFMKIGLTMILFGSFYDFMDGKFEGKLEHLWFLYYLIIFSVLYYLLVSIVNKTVIFKQQINKNAKVFSKSRAIIEFSFIGMLLILLRPFVDYLDGGAIGVASHYLTIKFGGIIYFLAWFCSGIWLYHNRELLRNMENKLTVILFGIVSALVFYFLAPNLTGIFGYQSVIPSGRYEFIIFSLLKGINTFLWCVFLIILTQQLMNKPSKLINWLVTLSFPIYLFHILPCLVVSALLIGLGLSQFLVIVGTVSLAFLICLILYYVLIKFTPLSWVILGYKKSWLKPFK